MKNSLKSAITLHCWYPSWDMQAAGLLFVVSILGITARLAQALGSQLPTSVALALTAGMVVAFYWWTYCRITITAQTVEIIGCGFLKPSYSKRIEEVLIQDRRALNAPYSSKSTSQFPLSIEVRQDQETGVARLHLQGNGETILNCFRSQQCQELLAAFARVLKQQANQKPAVLHTNAGYLQRTATEMHVLHGSLSAYS